MTKSFFVQKEWKDFINIFILFTSFSCSAKFCGWVNCLNEEKQNKIKYNLVLFCCAPYRIGRNNEVSLYVIHGTQPSAGTNRCQKKKKKRNQACFELQAKKSCHYCQIVHSSTWANNWKVWLSFSLFYNYITIKVTLTVS